MAAEYIVNHPDLWGDWKIYRYTYAGPGSDAHPDPSTIQAIIVGIYNPTTTDERCMLTIKKVDATNPNKPLQGAVFQVTATDGSFDKQYTTDEDGLIVITSSTESGFWPW